MSNLNVDIISKAHNICVPKDTHWKSQVEAQVTEAQIPIYGQRLRIQIMNEAQMFRLSQSLCFYFLKGLENIF